MLHLNNYGGGLFGLIPGAVTQSGRESVSGMRQMMQAVAAYGRGGGTSTTRSVIGVYELDPDRLVIFGKIREPENDSSSSSGSSSDARYSSLDAGFYDHEGNLAYAFDEVNPFEPWKGVIIEGGISTIPASEINQGGNFAYLLMPTELESGTLCVLVRAGHHWVIVGIVAEGNSSIPMTFLVDCEAGTIVVGPGGNQTIVPDPTTKPPGGGSSSIVPKPEDTGGGGGGGGGFGGTMKPDGR